MPPDTTALVRRFMPNNIKLGNIIIRVCEQEFKARTLPMQLIKVMVDRALDESRKSDNNMESRKMEEKLREYAVSIKPRFMSQIMESQRRGRRG